MVDDPSAQSQKHKASNTAEVYSKPYLTVAVSSSSDSSGGYFSSCSRLGRFFASLFRNAVARKEAPALFDVEVDFIVAVDLQSTIRGETRAKDMIRMGK
jgi:hypothetical protein